MCGGARHLAVVSVGLEFTLLAPRNFAEPFRFLVKKKSVCTPVSAVCHQQEKCRVISSTLVGRVTDLVSF